VDAIEVTPEVTGLSQEGYIVALRETALLGGVQGWLKTKIVWWPSDPVPGMDILFHIPRAAKELPTGTVFEAAVYWREREPGKGAPLWAGNYRVRTTPEGPVLEEVT
jgi:hypothetical protein